MNLQRLLEKYKVKTDIKMILDMWNEPNRYFHNLDHLNDILDQIEESRYNEETKDKLRLVALFHDIIYDPKRNDNELKSSEFFLSLCQEKNEDILEVNQAILDTEKHIDNTRISSLFNDMDMKIAESNIEDLMRWEKGIRKEYSFLDDKTYKEGRLKFIDGLMDRYPTNTSNLLSLRNYVRKNY